MNRTYFILVIAVLLMTAVFPPGELFGAGITPPASPVKLVFIHHSTGENWLRDVGSGDADTSGGLGAALRDNNYFVSDTNYEWGPDAIGSSTDIGNWYSWFAGPNKDIYTAALYDQSTQNAEYSRMDNDPGGRNQIIMFKSCFPNSYLGGNPLDMPTSGDNPLREQDAYSEHMTVANAKGIYNDVLSYFAAHQNRLFVALTAPPQASFDTDAEHAANARAFNDWLVNDWLKKYPYRNVAVFDFYNVLTSNITSGLNDAWQEGGNHHRWWNGQVQHVRSVDNNMSSYPSSDSHPSAAGGQKATAEFVPLLNYFYGTWREAEHSGAHCTELGDDLTLHIRAQYYGVQFGFELDFMPVASDPSGLYWKADVSTFSQIQRDPASCITITNDLKLNVCAQYQGIRFYFTLDFVSVPDDPSGVYWKADISTFEQTN